jgi:hypothetical protein
MKNPFKYHNTVHHSHFQNVKVFHIQRDDVQPELQKFLNTW